MNRFSFFVFAFLMSTFSRVYAHPGHDWLEHGGAHVVGSTYHLSIVALFTLLSFASAAFVSRPKVKRALHSFGIAGIACFALLWLLRY